MCNIIVCIVVLFICAYAQEYETTTLFTDITTEESGISFNWFLLSFIAFNLHLVFIQNGFCFIVPSKPLNLTVLAVTSDSISLRWMEPDRANGAIDGYRIYYMHANFTDVKSLKLNKGTGSHIQYTLIELSKCISFVFVFKYSLTPDSESEVYEPLNCW